MTGFELSSSRLFESADGVCSDQNKYSIHCQPHNTTAGSEFHNVNI